MSQSEARISRDEFPSSCGFQVADLRHGKRRWHLAFDRVNQPRRVRDDGIRLRRGHRWCKVGHIALVQEKMQIPGKGFVHWKIDGNLVGGEPRSGETELRDEIT